MADYKKLIPYIIKWEAGIFKLNPDGSWNDKYPIDKLFEEARETGFGNDPADSGGATMIGVTLMCFKAYRKKKKIKTPTVSDLKKISFEEWCDILKTMFWDKMQADRIENQSIANLCVNTIWGSGAGYIKTIQGVLGVRQDGVVGDITLGKINGWNPQSNLFDKLWSRRKKFFDDIVARSVADYEKKIGRKATNQELMKHTKKRFIKGWMNRLNDFNFYE